MVYKILRPPLHKNFELPTRNALLAVKPGHIVKIIFQAENETAERMWVRVTDQSNDSEWHGIVDNDPEGERLKGTIGAGDRVTFHPFDVIQIFDFNMEGKDD